MMFIDPDLVVSPKFFAEWNLCSLAMPPLMEIGRIVLVEPELAVELGITADSFALLDLWPDLNTLFSQATDITGILAKFGWPWHYVSGGRGVLGRVLAAVSRAAARAA